MPGILKKNEDISIENQRELLLKAMLDINNILREKKRKRIERKNKETIVNSNICVIQ